MSRTEEISNGVKGTGSGVADIRVHAEGILEFVRDQIEVASAHGWGGVAQSMTMVSDPLEGVIENLGSAETVCETAATKLDEITDTMSRQEVKRHLDVTLIELEGAYTAIEGTVPLLDETIQAAERSEDESLIGRIQNLCTEVQEVIGHLAQSRADTDIERQGAENLGRGVRTSGSPGNRSRVPEEDPPHRHPLYRQVPGRRRLAGPTPRIDRTGSRSGSLMLRTSNLSPAREGGRISSVR